MKFKYWLRTGESLFRSLRSWGVALGLMVLPWALSWAHAGHKILFLGDSLTEGYGLKREATYPHLIKEILIKEGMKDIEVINAGENGSKSSSALSRLKWQLRSRPTILVLALGANDGLRGVEPTIIKENLQKTLDLALEKKLRVLLVGIKMPLNYGEDYRKRFEAVFQDLHRQYADRVHYLPFLLEGVGGVRKYNLPDGIHPNEEGHKILAKNVLNSLRPLLQQGTQEGGAEGKSKEKRRQATPEAKVLQKVEAKGVSS